MLTMIAVMLLGLYLIVSSQTAIGSVAALVWGIVVVALVLVELMGYRPAWPRRAPPASGV